MNHHILTIQNHPFYVGVIKSADRGITQLLPFTIAFDYVYGMPRQIVSKEVREALDDAYRIGSMISTPLGESDLASDRLSAMYMTLIKVLNGKLNGKSILEIGCGTGELLRKLQDNGANVVGVEIGPQANFARDKYGIKILTKLPDSSENRVVEKFDCIISYGCLEHIEQLDELIESSKSNLKNGGLYFHSVPNAKISFECGEIDHLIHEHINYFTPKNAINLLRSRGFIDVDFCLTSMGNELMFWGYKSDLNGIDLDPFIVGEEVSMFTKYCEIAISQFNMEVDKIRQLINCHGEIAFYAGGFEHALKLDIEKIRFFDGDSYKHGKSWLEGMKAIENPEIVSKDRPNLVIIFKRHYFQVIKQSLVNLGFNPDSVLNIDDLDGSKRLIN